MIEFEKVITNCIPTAKESQKKLSTDLLNNHFSSAITMAEQLKTKLTHLSSLVNLKKLRADTKFLSAYAKCSFNKQCKSTYHLLVVEKIYSMEEKIEITIKRTNDHNHQDNNQNIIDQVRGQSRTLLAARIEKDHGGSSHETRLHDLADNTEKQSDEKVSVPNAETYKKVKNDEKFKNLPTRDWLINLQYVALSYQTQNNFVRDLNIFPQLSFNIFLDKALEILNNIPAEHRITFIDATGRLVRIPKKSCSFYNKIFNYFLLVKDLRTHGTPKFRSFYLSEMISSSHDTEAICNMFRKVRIAYETKFKNKLRFRIIVMDFSWPTMHAVLEALNLENMITYAHKVFRLGSISFEELPNFIEQGTWIVSCCAHTMKRFHRCVKSNVKQKEIITLACYAFSLLLNSTELSMLEEIFKVIVYVFYSETQSKLFLDNVQKLEKFINERPLVQGEVDKIIREKPLFSIAKKNDDEEKESEGDEEDECECGECEACDYIAERNLTNYDEALFNKIDYSIKDESPFTSFFLNIYDTCCDEISQHDLNNVKGAPNTLLCPNFIEKVLLDRFCPYAFIWSGITCKDSNYIMTRWTNGTSEKNMGTKKDKNKSFLNIDPASYVLSSYKTHLGKCVDYEELQEKTEKYAKTPKRKIEEDKNTCVE
jgi:hypothetical protein